MITTIPIQSKFNMRMLFHFENEIRSIDDSRSLMVGRFIPRSSLGLLLGERERERERERASQFRAFA